MEKGLGQVCVPAIAPIMIVGSRIVRYGSIPPAPQALTLGQAVWSLVHDLLVGQGAGHVGHQPRCQNEQGVMHLTHHYSQDSQDIESLGGVLLQPGQQYLLLHSSKSILHTLAR